MLKSKEHYDLMTQFENDIRKAPGLHFNPRFDREEKRLWSKGHIYSHGETNTLFLAYRLGYAFGKVAE